MKVLLLNTYPHGGAGVACRRLHHALEGVGVSASILHSEEAGPNWPFYAERIGFLPFERDKSVRFAFSPANFGKRIARHPAVQEADVLHLHWINQGMVSLRGLAALGRLGKPIIWTLHDMWAFTGGCHYSGSCTGYQSGCGQCPYLRHPGQHDLSSRIFRRKLRYYPPNIHFVTCSQWLCGVASQGMLLQGYPIQAIPNPIDTQVFAPLSPGEIAAFRASQGIRPGARVFLFAAMKVSDARKGFEYLQKALQDVRIFYPQDEVEILIMGKADPEIVRALPYPTHLLGMLHTTESLRQAYGSADVFVIPSLEDNLPNTVMEALACGTPVAGFDTGGIPEMVGHLREGYIAPQRDPQELAAGIHWISRDREHHKQLREQARAKALACYSESVVAKQYIDLYARALADRH